MGSLVESDSSNDPTDSRSAISSVVHMPDVCSKLEERLTTSVLVHNLHCTSCVAHIRATLSGFNPAVQEVDVSIVTHEVHVSHMSSIKVSDLCRALEEAAFEVNSARTVNKEGATISQLDFTASADSWLVAATDILRQPRHAVAKSSPLLQPSIPNRIKRKRHLQICAACQAEDIQASEDYSNPPVLVHDLEKHPTETIDTNLRNDAADSERATKESLAAEEGIPLSLASERGLANRKSTVRGKHHEPLPAQEFDSASLDGTAETLQSARSQTYQLLISVGGMTSASCSNVITDALEDLETVEHVNVDLMTNCGSVRFSGSIALAGTIVETVQGIGYEATVISCEPISKMSNNISTLGRNKYRAVLSIGGMTCASCSNAILDGLREFPYVIDVNIILMTNSGTVIFEGKEHLDDIIAKVDDLGYDCTADHCSAVDISDERPEEALEPQMRIAELKIAGMHCDHCPVRIQEALRFKLSEQVVVEKLPTLKDPLLRVLYRPYAPDFTIRDVITAINSVDEAFNTSLYHPPSIEDRSKAIQIHERQRILGRLLFSFVIAIPTLLIGVIWMSMVPSSNATRMFLEKPIWAGNVTRAEWALFILATPIYFFAADVFHVRAIKEIRALWRKSSRVPVLRRFYRFGSMNLLISAGTSVAYFASLALLVIDATAQQVAANETTYFDTVVFLTFFILIGRYLEAYSKSKTGDAVAMLGRLRPQEALLLTPSKSMKQSSAILEEKSSPVPSPRKINADLLEVGDVVLVTRGSSPPADGIILSGFAQFDESSLTGESRTVKKGPGEKVFVGTVNAGDSITVEVLETGGSSMLDQIVSVVREGQTKRAPVERFADVLTGYFVPIITGLAIVTFFVWFSLGQSGVLSSSYIDGQAGGWAFWSLEFAIAVFVVACPCGIGLAAPTALFVGGGLAAKHGILVRGGGEAFQEAGDLDAVVFDKTGTLTEGGEVKVTDHEMLAEGEDANTAWSIVRALEGQSSHPIAQAIASLASTKPSASLRIGDVWEQPGLGMCGTFSLQASEDGNIGTFEAALGSEKLISSLNPHPPSLDYFTSQTLSTWKSQSKSIALLAIRHLLPTHKEQSAWTLTALFATSDPIRLSALPCIQNLQSRGLAVYMLTGDNSLTAAAVASSLNIPIANVFAGVLPTEKADKIKWLQEHGPRRTRPGTSWTCITGPLLSSFRRRKGNPETRKAKVAFVGDGINDAPALATATASGVSVSLSSGSPVALSSSSFIILSPSEHGPSLLKIPLLLDLSARVFTRIKFNFAWALVYNVVLVPVAAGVFFGLGTEGKGWRLGPVWASAAMAGSSVSVVVSSLLLRWEKKGKGNSGLED